MQIVWKFVQWALFNLFVNFNQLAAAVAQTETPSFSSQNPPHPHPHHHRYYVRDVAQGAAVPRAGITGVTLSADRQSYYALMQTGNIFFRVALDTASSDLWITSSECKTKTCQMVPRYPLEYQSPTFVSVNNNLTTFKAGYADGTEASGFVARETIQLSNVTLGNQAFGLVTSSNVVLTDQTSGVLGLGFPRLSEISTSVPNSQPFFVTLAQNGLLQYPLFGVSLTRNSSGTLTLGAIDGSVVTNKTLIKWNKVIEFPPFGSDTGAPSYLQWAIPLVSIAIDNEIITPIPTFTHQATQSSIALIDIGASGIYGPYQDVVRLYSLIDGARLIDPGGQWAVPCNTVAQLTFRFGQTNFILQPTDYIIGVASGNPSLCLSWPRSVPPGSDGIDWQLGDAFLRTVYTIYDYGINSKEPPYVGFYSLNRTNTNDTPSLLSFLSSNSATISTTLPNSLLNPPSFTTPPYIFNPTISAPVGGIVSSDLATSTYSAILGTNGGGAGGGGGASNNPNVNMAALPMIFPTPSVSVITTTGSDGVPETSTVTQPVALVTLGVPPGWTPPPSAASLGPLRVPAVLGVGAVGGVVLVALQVVVGG